MYNCGPTVYDRVHIGNLRAFFVADLLRRVFKQAGFKVNQVMNITDVDDKTIKRSQEEGVSLSVLAKKYEDLFLADLGEMNIEKPGTLPRATENISLMVKLIQKLIDGGYAYESDDGIYFSIGKAKNYGQLIKISLGKKSRARIKNDEYDKDNPQDFALWKFHTKEDGDVSWEAPFGRGRPGWHIECSAMSMGALGENFDIHTGGIDLLFPHHENEIAQSESATGEKFVNIWVHNNHILVNQNKMSKSLGNTYTLSDLKEKNTPPLAYRYWLLTSHYRTLVNFTWEAVLAAKNALEKLYDMVAELPDGGRADEAYKAEFRSFTEDDLDTPKAVALAWELIRDKEIAPADKKATLIYFDEIFGLGLKEAKAEKIPEEITALAEKREKAREGKDWETADKARVEIESRGYEIKDTESGFRLKKTK